MKQLTMRIKYFKIISKGLVLAVLMLCFSNLEAQENSFFTIRGNIKGLKNGDTVKLTFWSIDKQEIDSMTSLVYSESFNFFNIKSVVPLWRTITIANYRFNILTEASDIRIKGMLSDVKFKPFKKIIISGSSSNDHYFEFLNIIDPFVKNRDSLEAIASALTDSLQLVTISGQLNGLKNKINEIWKKQIESHPNSYYTPHLINQPNLTFYEKKDYYKKLSEKVKASTYGIQLSEKLDIEQLSNSIGIGKIAPDFSSMTPAGKTLTFSEIVLTSKLTLVDFWASWCKPCVQEIANLKRVYNEFHCLGFNILSVSFDYNGKDWNDALINYNMPWPQVSQLKGPMELAGRIYGIYGIPACLLIDSTGKLIAADAILSGVKETGKSGSLRGSNLYEKVYDYFKSTK